MNLIKAILGEAVEDEQESSVSRVNPRHEPESKARSLVGRATGDEPGDVSSGEDADPDMNSEVQSLVSAWQSGSKLDVAEQVLDTQMTFRDLFELTAALGQEDAVELGSMMDEIMAEKAEDAEEDAGDAGLGEGDARGAEDSSDVSEIEQPAET